MDDTLMRVAFFICLLLFCCDARAQVTDHGDPITVNGEALTDSFRFEQLENRIASLEKRVIALEHPRRHRKHKRHA